MRFHRSGAIAAAVLLSLGAGACGKSSSSTSSTTTGASGSATTTGGATATTAASTPAGSGGISIKNFMFSPNPATAKVGDTITITNNDTTAHTVTADDGSFDTKDIAPGTTATIKVTKAGSVAFHCNIHQFMKASITVSS